MPLLSTASKVAGGEDKLLDEFENLGLHCNPLTQLVITCEVCRRPSTKECWTCGMKICDFCTLKRHWKVVGVARRRPSPSSSGLANVVIRPEGMLMIRTHMQGSVGLHWPLIYADTMLDSLGRRELEQKKKDDARR